MGNKIRIIKIGIFNYKKILRNKNLKKKLTQKIQKIKNNYANKY